MPEPPDLLLITWNRRPYVEKTVAHLLADPADFRLYCWDNGSEDGTADLIRSLDDERVAVRHFSKENVRQREPSLWFFERAKSDVVGKIDDDILLPHGWTRRIAPMLRAEPRFGLLGCWIFMPEDWDEELARPNIVEAGGYRVLRFLGRAGQSFLARRELLRRYIEPAGRGYGFPVAQARMSVDGYINGFPLPLLMAHNMDDPRSPHCLMGREGVGERAALSARMRGLKTPEEYAAWIRADARKKLSTPVDELIRRKRWEMRAPRLTAWMRKLRRGPGKVLRTLGMGRAATTVEHD